MRLSSTLAAGLALLALASCTPPEHDAVPPLGRNTAPEPKWKGGPGPEVDMGSAESRARVAKSGHYGVLAECSGNGHMSFTLTRPQHGNQEYSDTVACPGAPIKLDLDMTTNEEYVLSISITEPHLWGHASLIPRGNS